LRKIPRIRTRGVGSPGPLQLPRARTGGRRHSGMSAATGERVLAWAWVGTIPYREAWALQSSLAEDRRAGRLADDLVLVLEHPPVYTMGRNGEPRHVPSGSHAP